jgi:uncharacterized protein (TIGR03067 family)
MAAFDPYHKWLGIPPADQPPNHYRLLGLNLFESDPDVIDVATEQRVVYLRGCATGEHIAESQKLLNEVAAARLCLLNVEKKRAYDMKLRSALERTSPASDESPPPPTMPWESEPEESTSPVESKTPHTARKVQAAAKGKPSAKTWQRVAVIVGGLLVLVIIVSLMKGGKETATSNDGGKSPEASQTTEGIASRKVAQDSEKRPTTKPPAKSSESTTSSPPKPNAADDNAKQQAQEIARSDSDRLQGRWECVFEEAAGTQNTAAELAAMKKVLTVNGNQLTIQRVINGVPGEYRGTFSLGLESDRRLFDFTGTGPNGRPVTWLGLYEFEGEIFKVCYRVRSENDLNPQRADSFGTFANSNRVSNKFRRITDPAVASKSLTVSDVPRPIATGFESRFPAARQALLDSGGGTAESERAVAAALSWLARHQSPDGSWNCQKFTAQCKDPSCRGHVEGVNKSFAATQEFPVGATTFGLLPMLAAGMTTESDGPYQSNIRRGLSWLLMKQDKNTGRFGEAMYEHALATITLCEAYGLSRDPKLRTAADSAVDYIQRAQHSAGGWRYKPNDPGDTSVTGWMMLGLRSAQMAGLQVSSQTINKANGFLKTVARGKSGGLAAYQTNGTPSPSMSAIALLCRQWDGAKRSDPALVEGMNYLIANPPHSMKNCYYSFWATQAMHNLSGTEWIDWNDRARELLIATQIQEGCAAGSWSPEGQKDTAGPMMITSLNALTLQIYYRSRSLYQADNREQAAASAPPAIAKANDDSRSLSDPLKEVARLINAERQKQGLSKLKNNALLVKAAQSQSDWMAQVGKMEHLRGKEAANFEDWKRSDHHPVNRVIQTGYIDWQQLFTLEVKSGNQVLVAKPNADNHVGEIIAHGNPNTGPGRFDPAVIVAGWMNSPGHRKTILTGPFEELGVGFTRTKPGDAFWCVAFGKKP